MITLPQHPEANQALGEVATELDVRGVNAAEYMPAAARGAIRLRLGADGQGRFSADGRAPAPEPGAGHCRGCGAGNAAWVPVTPAAIAEGIGRRVGLDGWSA